MLEILKTTDLAFKAAAKARDWPQHRRDSFLHPNKVANFGIRRSLRFVTQQPQLEHGRLPPVPYGMIVPPFYKAFEQSRKPVGYIISLFLQDV